MLTNKIPLIGIAIIVLAASGCVGGPPEEAVKLTPEESTKNLSEIDLIESLLGQLKATEIDLDIPSDFLDFDFMKKLDVSPEDFVSFKDPKVSIDAAPGVEGVDIEAMRKSGATPPPDWEPDEATCAEFRKAPSCLFVPKQYRDLCEKCRELDRERGK
jgi:hypothetical protein